MEISGLLKWVNDHRQRIGESIASVMVATGSYYFGRWKSRKDLRESADRKAVRALVDQLPPFNDIRRFFKEKALTDSFKTGTMDSFLDAVERTLGNPLATFHSKSLRRKLEKVGARGRVLRTLVARETFPVPQRAEQDEQTIRRVKYGDSIDDMETGEKLNALASEVFVAYDEFLRHAKSVIISLDDGRS